MIWLSLNGMTMTQECDNPLAKVSARKQTVLDSVKLVPLNKHFKILLNRNGHVLTVTNGDGICTFEPPKDGNSQLFTLKVEKNQVVFQSLYNGKYLGASKGSAVCRDTEQVLWDIACVPMALEAHTGNIMETSYWNETADAPNNVKEKGQMYMLPAEKGVRFLSRWNNQFLHVKKDGRCSFSKNSEHDREVFQIIPVENGKIKIKSVFNGKWMTTDPSGKIWCTNQHADSQSVWKLHWLDDTGMVTLQNLRTFGIIGATATTFAVAAPFAVMGAIGAAGFGAGGVVGGSLAAGIQSGIGSVAAGSWFATLQSVGVLGLSASATAGAAAGGVAVGAGIGTGAAQFVGGNAVDQEGLANGMAG